MRSPVVAFAGMADLLISYAASQDTVRLLALADRLRQAATSLHGLLDNLLTWALAQRGEVGWLYQDAATTKMPPLRSG